jgi:PleD family two-component response regulator
MTNPSFEIHDPKLTINDLAGEVQFISRTPAWGGGCANELLGVSQKMKANEKEKSADKAANSRAVLVVDDLEGIRSLLKESLAPEGYAVLSARNGQEAVKIAEAVSISLLLSDVQMPGIDGVKLANHLKGVYPETSAYDLLRST